jgi:NAD-dependent SIR2 family protein deacetylase
MIEKDDDPEGALRAAVQLLRSRSWVALTGAGISTESGIPDYRGPETQKRARNPVRYNAFVGDERSRRRYWARSTLGWPRIRDAHSNAAHHALAEMEAAGKCRGVITQNVDRLHEKAKSHQVVELHGGLHRVRCLNCTCIEDRQALQDRILIENPGWLSQAGEVAPDGDVELPGDMEAAFKVLGCERCGGELKPDVVFFGENVPPEVLSRAWQLFERAEALVVVGSSLEVFSGRRFVMEAKKRSLPVIVFNLGPTRSHADVTVHVEGRAGEMLPRLKNALVSGA